MSAKTSLLGAAACLLLSSAAHSAQVSLELLPNTLLLGSVVAVMIKGDIQVGDAEALGQKLSEFGLDKLERADRRRVIVVSQGGDAYEGMKIGRILRAQNFETMLPPRMDCLSACVYALAAGVDKTVEGNVGIHRPYFGALPRGGVAARFKSLISDSKAYFAEMNIPTTLVDDMFSIPPEDMRILTNAELTKYRLNRPDFVIEEQSTLEEMKQYHMTRPEYVEFQAKLNRRCGIFLHSQKEMLTCTHAVGVEAGFLR